MITDHRQSDITLGTVIENLTGKYISIITNNPDFNHVEPFDPSTILYVDSVRLAEGSRKYATLECYYTDENLEKVRVYPIGVLRTEIRFVCDTKEDVHRLQVISNTYENIVTKLADTISSQLNDSTTDHIRILNSLVEQYKAEEQHGDS